MVFVGDFVPQHSRPVVPDFGMQWVVANLEGPVCADGLSPSEKVGMHLYSAPFEVAGRWAFSLANNHMMDYGQMGLDQTHAFLNKQGYSFAGAGENEKAAREPMILEEAGKRIAVISCCERQFGVATDESAGVAEKGVWLYQAIAEAKKESDYVVISCHCASEYSSAVSPQLQKFYHSLIDVGADVIHGHHAHVPQGWEAYRGRPIFYGLGNFVVDRKRVKRNPHLLWSLVAHVDFSGRELTWRVTPHGAVPSDVDNYLRLANLGFEHPELMIALWQKTCVELYLSSYVQNLGTTSVISRAIPQRERLRKGYFALRDLMQAIIGREVRTGRSLVCARVLYNCFNCESHVDVISTALGVLTGAVKDERNKLEGYLSC